MPPEDGSHVWRAGLQSGVRKSQEGEQGEGGGAFREQRSPLGVSGGGDVTGLHSPPQIICAIIAARPRR
ncbi:hypothetical protein PAHAL_3G104500 [Panicum hallii]|jgi:hypothetical protein|uniref:Uncharacterized protein n=1 Tax=Panicum hallii TaxID=206008 RepID=A0A2S3H7Z8_9POAL|nr:hypothetical protein PAHAL_3G104500 [Panicum hallii]